MLFGKNISMDLAIRVLCVYVCVYAQACACMVACTKTNLNGLNFPFPNTHLTYFAFLSYTRVHTHTSHTSFVVVLIYPASLLVLFYYPHYSLFQILPSNSLP